VESPEEEEKSPERRERRRLAEETSHRDMSSAQLISNWRGLLWINDEEDADIVGDDDGIKWLNLDRGSGSCDGGGCCGGSGLA